MDRFFQYLLECKMRKVFFLVVFGVAGVIAQVNFLPTVNLSNTMSATSDYHAVFADGSNFYVVWGDNGMIKFKRSTNCGVSWYSNVTVYDGSSISGWPVLYGVGNTIVVLYHYNGTNGYVVHCQRSTDYGDTWSQPIVISTQNNSTGITPKITFDGSTLYAAWEERPGKYQIYFAKSTDLGISWSTPVNVSNTIVDSRWVQVLYQSGRLHCIWLDSPSYPAHDIAYIYSDDGGVTWSPYRKLTEDVLPQTRVALAARDNSVYIASQDMYQINFSEIALMKSTDKGITWSAPVNLTNNSGNSSFADLAIADEPNGQHRIYMSWFDNTHSAPNYDNSDIYFSMSTNSGDNWSTPVNLSNNPDNSYQARIALKRFPGSDSLFVIWYDYSTGNAEILGRQGVYGYVVPVELISFSATTINGFPVLRWTTATEMNNDRFEIFRISGENSVNIGTIKGKGTSTEPTVYEFTDNELNTNSGLYHLYQIDFDGSRHFLGEASVESELPSGFVLEQNYPNPFSTGTESGVTTTTIRYRLQEGGMVTIKLYNSTGVEIKTLVNKNSDAGVFTTSMDANVENLTSGVYFYKMTVTTSSGKTRSDVKKLVILK